MKKLLFIFSICCQSAQAQTSLSAIEQQMFNDKNERFIAVDLIRDKLLTTGQPFVFSYSNNKAVLNGKELPAWYAERMKSFGLSGSFHWASDSIGVKELYDPTSNFRNAKWRPRN